MALTTLELIEPTGRFDPPADLLSEIDAAFARSGELFASELELHFAVDPFTARVSGELRAPGGRAFARLSAAETLAIACGDVRLSA